MAYRSLSKERQARFDPMITGFNPADMYAADHIRRVLKTFPGVFTGIGEFTIHKEFVSSKVAGEVASLTDPAVDRILDFAGEVGLVVLLHNDMDMPFAKAGTEPVFLTQMKALLARHPKTTIIWAHMGLDASCTRCRPLPRAPHAAKPQSRRDRGADPLRPEAPPRLLRHQLGRGGQVPPGYRRDHASGGGDDQPLSRPVPVRLRRRGAEGHGAVLRGVRGLSSPVATAHPGGQRKGAQGKLQAVVRPARRRVRAWERGQGW